MLINDISECTGKFIIIKIQQSYKKRDRNCYACRSIRRNIFWHDICFVFLFSSQRLIQYVCNMQCQYVLIPVPTFITSQALQFKSQDLHLISDKASNNQISRRPEAAGLGVKLVCHSDIQHSSRHHYCRAASENSKRPLKPFHCTEILSRFVRHLIVSECKRLFRLNSVTGVYNKL